MLMRGRVAYAFEASGTELHRSLLPTAPRQIGAGISAKPKSRSTGRGLIQAKELATQSGIRLVVMATLLSHPGIH